MKRQKRTAKCLDGITLTQARLDRDRRQAVHVTAGGLRMEASPVEAAVAAAVVARRKAAPAGRRRFRLDAGTVATMMLPGSQAAITEALKPVAEVLLENYLEAKVRMNTMKTLKTLMVMAVLAMPAVAAAQSAPANTHLQITMYRTGSTTPAVAPFEIAIADMACNQPVTPPPSGVVTNPTQIVVDDPNPATPGRECRWQEPGTGIIAMLGFDPAATYFARGAWRNPNGLSEARTDSNPFSRPGTVPSVPPAFVRVVPGL